MTRTSCPHCGSDNAWLTKDAYDVTLRCICGFNRVLVTRLETVEIMHNDAGPNVKLPKFDSNLHKTLMVLSILPTANSAEITDRLRDLGVNVSVSDVSSYLTILRSKGLVATITVRRGMAGGSTWELSDAAEGLLDI